MQITPLFLTTQSDVTELKKNNFHLHQYQIYGLSYIIICCCFIIFDFVFLICLLFKRQNIFLNFHFENLSYSHVHPCVTRRQNNKVVWTWRFTIFCDLIVISDRLAWKLGKPVTSTQCGYIEWICDRGPVPPGLPEYLLLEGTKCIFTKCYRNVKVKIRLGIKWQINKAIEHLMVKLISPVQRQTKSRSNKKKICVCVSGF